MTVLERIMSSFPKNNFGDSGIDHTRTGQASSNSDFSASPYGVIVTGDSNVPPFIEEWD